MPNEKTLCSSSENTVKSAIGNRKSAITNAHLPNLQIGQACIVNSKRLAVHLELLLPSAFSSLS
jgi:hypothetical protein